MSMRLLGLFLGLTISLSSLSPADAAPLCSDLFSLSKEALLRKDHNNYFKMQDALLAKETGKPTVVVYFGSLTYFFESVKEIKGFEIYSSRFLGPAVQEVIKNPHVTVVYPINSLVTRAEILHFASPHIREILRENPNKTREELEEDIFNRLKIVNIKKQTDSIFISDHLLSDPKAQREILSYTTGRNSYIQPWTATPLELKVATKLNLPINASSRLNKVYGNTKSGNHEIFRRTDVPHPLSRINLNNRTDAAKGIFELWKKTGHTKYMVKLEEGTSGKGNASFTIAPKAVQVLQKKTEKEAISYLENLIYTDLKPQGSLSSRQYWDIEVKAQKHIMVEQFIINYREGKDPSPSFQFFINAGGRVKAVSTHEQIFHPVNKQTFVGAQYPASHKYRKQIIEYGIKIAAELAKEGMVGYGGVDFVVTRDGKIYAIEINSRVSGTTHTFLTAHALQKNNSKDFHSISTDNYESLYLKRFKSSEELLEHPDIKPLLYDIKAGEGVVFHLMGAMPMGKVGFQAIARTPERARHIYEKVSEILDPQ